MLSLTIEEKPSSVMQQLGDRKRKELSWQATLSNTRRFSREIAEVVETSPANPAFGEQFNLFNARIMQREGFLDAYAMRNFPYGIGRIHGAMLALDNHTLKNLNTFLAALNDADMHLHAITWAKVGMILPHLFQINSINYCAHIAVY